MFCIVVLYVFIYLNTPKINSFYFIIIKQLIMMYFNRTQKQYLFQKIVNITNQLQILISASTKINNNNFIIEKTPTT